MSPAATIRPAGGAATDDAASGTRERILRAAAAMFRRQGFHGTSMQDLAGAVGINKSSLYHHFPSKQALLSEIVAFTVARVTPDVEAVAGSGRPPDQQLRAAVRLHVLAAIEDRDNVACFIEEGRFLAPDALAEQLPRRDHYEGCFRSIIERGVGVGAMDARDVALATRAILGMCNDVVRWYRPEGAQDPDAIADEFAELAVRMTTCSGAPDTEGAAA